MTHRGLRVLPGQLRIVGGWVGGRAQHGVEGAGDVGVAVVGVVLLETAPVLAAAEPVLQAAGVADRCETVAGDFFREVPPGADLYILSNIVHDWDDDSALRILGTCRAAMRADSRLLIIELVLPEDPRLSMGKLLDLEMLSVTPNGRQRTAAQ